MVMSVLLYPRQNLCMKESFVEKSLLTSFHDSNTQHIIYCWNQNSSGKFMGVFLYPQTLRGPRHNLRVKESFL